MKTKFLCLAVSLVAGTGAAAQTDAVASFDMTLNSGITVTEGVTGRSFAVNHNLTPENIDGAIGKALRLDDTTIYNKAFTAEEAAMPEPENAADLSIPASRYAADVLRPTFHGMPATAWTNECHGMAYSGGRYHLFFQKNANGSYMARLHWGHIWSENLYKWHEDRIAIAPSETYDIKGCWSGAVFTDPDQHRRQARHNLHRRRQRQGVNQHGAAR